MALLFLLQEKGIKNTRRTWNFIDLFTCGIFRQIYFCNFPISKKNLVDCKYFYIYLTKTQNFFHKHTYKQNFSNKFLHDY